MQIENIYEVFKTNSNRCYVLKTVWKPHSSTEEITEEKFKEYYNFKINRE